MELGLKFASFAKSLLNLNWKKKFNNDLLKPDQTINTSTNIRRGYSKRKQRRIACVCRIEQNLMFLAA